MQNAVWSLEAYEEGGVGTSSLDFRLCIINLVFQGIYKLIEDLAPLSLAYYA